MPNVPVAKGLTAAQVATAVRAAIDADADLSATVAGAVVTANAGASNTFSKVQAILV